MLGQAQGTRPAAGVAGARPACGALSRMCSLPEIGTRPSHHFPSLMCTLSHPPALFYQVLSVEFMKPNVYVQNFHRQTWICFCTSVWFSCPYHCCIVSESIKCL